MSTCPTLSTREPNHLLERFQRTRAKTVSLCDSLETEDMVVQTMPDVSPTKWHLAHTTWFFELLVLQRFEPSYKVFDARFHELFNSYYQSLGQPFPREHRGLLSRPTARELFAYRHHVDLAMQALLRRPMRNESRAVAEVVTIGMQHEQQHQELLLMDIKHVLASNPLRPAYAAPSCRTSPESSRISWRQFEEELVEVGAVAGGFAYDNERPRHQVMVPSFELASRLVTAGEWLRFMSDGGYAQSSLWLADGWDLVQAKGWKAPLYWEAGDGGWHAATLTGLRPIDPSEPVCHVSYYEADAYARWAGCRLPTEFEWEHAAGEADLAGSFLEAESYHPQSARASQGWLTQMSGEVWQWTSSPYIAYPGYRAFDGALSEYNGKFMANQMVLRGASCVTPELHARRTYRNFYYPHQRWMFSGLRLAR